MAFGVQRVIAGTTTFGAAIAEPGVVVDGGVPVASTIAELAGGITPRLEAIAAVLGEAGLPATVSADPYLTVWRKFLLFAPGATRQSACAEPFGPIFALPEGLALCRQLVMEAVAVGRAEKVALPDDIVETIMAFTALVPPGATSSMARDFEGRRRVELEQSTGTIVRRRRAHGVPTPAFDALYAVLKVRALAYGGLREG